MDHTICLGVVAIPMNKKTDGATRIATPVCYQDSIFGSAFVYTVIAGMVCTTQLDLIS